MRLKNGHKKKFLLKDKNNVLGESWKKVSRLQRMCMLRCVWLCDSMDYSLPGSSVHGISQVRILEEVAISFSRGSSWPRDQTLYPVSPALAGRFFFATEPPGKPKSIMRLTLNQTSQFIIYLSYFCFTFSMWLEVFLYAVVILITFFLLRKVSLNSLGFVLCLSLEKGNWTNSLNRETFSLRIWKCH